MKHFSNLISFLLLLSSFTQAKPVKLPGFYTAHELIAERSHIRPGQTITIGIHQLIDKGCKTYWEYAGDQEMGEPRVKWTLPKGWSISELQWPTPLRLDESFDDFSQVAYYYKDEVTLLAELTAPAGIAEDSVTIKGDLFWLECDPTMCFAREQTVKLILPVKSDPPTPVTAHAEKFAQARKALPVHAGGWRFQAEKEDRDAGKKIILTASPPESFTHQPEKVEFYPLTGGLFNLRDTGTWQATGSNFVMTLSDEGYDEAPDQFEGILMSVNGWGSGDSKSMAIQATLGEEITIPVQKDAARAVDGGNTETTDAAGSEKGFLILALWMFLGGLILNLMPCVFPVISLKVLSFVKQAHDTNTRPWHHGLVFGVGILVSFWIVVGVMLFLRGTLGKEIAWGFPMQYPGFNIAMMFLFCAIGLNLLGVFEVGEKLTGVGGKLQSKNGFAGSFLSGALAVLVATPCTAPFMAGALPGALSQPPVIALILFTFLGMGMALPYILLSSFPALIDRMPPPGPWMITFKQIVGLLMLAVVVWFSWNYVELTSGDSLVNMLAGLLLLGTGLWIYGKWGALHQPLKSKLLAWVGLLVFASLAVFWALRPPADVKQKFVADPNVLWQPWSEAAVREARSKGMPVFVDFTARWCLTCQYNKKKTLRRAPVERAFKENGVITLVADYTKKNVEIAAGFQALGQEGVPVYPLYPADLTAQPELLPNPIPRDLLLKKLKEVRRAEAVSAPGEPIKRRDARVAS